MKNARITSVAQSALSAGGTPNGTAASEALSFTITQTIRTNGTIWRLIRNVPTPRASYTNYSPHLSHPSNLSNRESPCVSVAILIAALINVLRREAQSPHGSQLNRAQSEILLVCMWSLK
jgi:hypothetical protein